MKTMKKFAALMMLLCALMICTIPALAANESGSDSNVTETVSVTAGSNDNDVTSAKAMGSGVMIGIPARTRACKARCQYVCGNRQQPHQ